MHRIEVSLYASARKINFKPWKWSLSGDQVRKQAASAQRKQADLNTPAGFEAERAP